MCYSEKELSSDNESIDSKSEVSDGSESISTLEFGSWISTLELDS